MSQFIVNTVSKELNLSVNSVKNTISLIEDGATIPFISRYRKEKTGGLDETQVADIFEKHSYFTELEKRKETVLKTINDQDKLTPELEKQIRDCTDKNELEDIYLPFKPKKRTRATIAREKGLEGLAKIIFSQTNLNKSKDEILASYIDEKKEVTSAEDALAGAKDIIAEWVSERADIRKNVRNTFFNSGEIISKVKKSWAKKKSKFQDYYDFSELLKKSPPHRMLAIRRGEKEGILGWKIAVDDERMILNIEKAIVKNNQFMFLSELKDSISDSYKRLIFPSVEKESFNIKIENCEEESIDVFSKNLKNLLLAPPAGSKVIMGVDPGFRTGCKVAVVDSNGDFKEFKAIYPHEPQNKKSEAENVLLGFIKNYNVDLIAIGNGTASKESDVFVRDILKKHGLNVNSMVVSEAGASVYSASPRAKEEFPSLDVTVRGAISIARRLQDPLAELVKIDPKSIGVGQYQHDVNQKALRNSLDIAVESCVNHVGVELNTASIDLLSYVSGISKPIAKNIVKYRSENGKIKSRKELNKVPKLGEKAFEQCAGFLRLRQSKNPLDNSAIHPETYSIVEKMAKDENVKITDMIGNGILLSKIDIKKYVTDQFGIPTLTDIIQELQKPGLDPRKEFASIQFSDKINEIEDLQVDMELQGNVTNVTDFGAFVDIGVHQDGLIHISKLSNSFVKNPHDIISVGDTVKVKVLSVDAELKRISLERLGE